MEIKDGTFSHIKGKHPTLHDVSLSVNPGSLTAIVGSVGAGKSSILSAVLGDMYKQNGKVTVNVSNKVIIYITYII